MRICFFADATNYHTQKWVNFFSSIGCDVHVLTLAQCDDGAYPQSNASIHWLTNSSDKAAGDLNKLSYLSTIHQAKLLLEQIDPDVVHAHYASSYGLVCALSCSKPFYLSVWGKDIYEFPKKSFLHKTCIKLTLRKASWIFSTSYAMERETKKYTNKQIMITPFGVDMSLFSPSSEKEKDSGKLVIGTVKALEKKYGIDVLLEAIPSVVDSLNDREVEVRIAGKGKYEAELKALSDRLGIGSHVVWLGFISQEEAAEAWRSFDIAVVPSIDESESFGVSAVEAQASGVPLIVSDIPGLLEACNGGECASVVPRGDAAALARAIVDLANDSAKRERMAYEGRRYVAEEYEISNCFSKVLAQYKKNL